MQVYENSGYLSKALVRDVWIAPSVGWHLGNKDVRNPVVLFWSSGLQRCDCHSGTFLKILRFLSGGAETACRAISRAGGAANNICSHFNNTQIFATMLSRRIKFLVYEGSLVCTFPQTKKYKSNWGINRFCLKEPSFLFTWRGSSSIRLLCLVACKLQQILLPVQRGDGAGLEEQTGVSGWCGPKVPRKQLCRCVLQNSTRVALTRYLNVIILLAF